MKWFQLIAALLPVFEEVLAAIEATLGAGKTPIAVHSAVIDHMAQLPAVIRGI